MFRIVWHQNDDGVVRVKWYTGTEAKCNLVAEACLTLREPYWILKPGEFK